MSVRVGEIIRQQNQGREPMARFFTAMTWLQGISISASQHSPLVDCVDEHTYHTCTDKIHDPEMLPATTANPIFISHPEYLDNARQQ